MTETADDPREEPNNALDPEHELIENVVFQLRFDLLRNAIYHTDQLGFYTAVSRLTKFLSVLTSTAAVGMWLVTSPIIAAITTSIVAFLNTVDLVFNVTNRARAHESLRQRYFLLLSEVEAASPSMRLAKRIRGEMTKLYGEEPNTKWGVDAVAWNHAKLALFTNVPPNALIRITITKSVLRHLWPFTAEDFPRPTSD